MQHLKSSEYQLRCSISFISLFSLKLGHCSQTAELVNLTESWGVTTKCLIFFFVFVFVPLLILSSAFGSAACP